MNEIIYVLGLCLVLCILAYWQRVLDLWGSLLAFIVGAIIGIFGGIEWLILLLFFLITSFGATKYKYSLKKERGFAEGKIGERHIKNVFANGMAPTLIAFLSYEGFDIIEEKWIAEVVFISAVSVAAADTVASELGVFSDRAYLITNLKRRVKPGTSGGVSWRGQSWALVAATYTGFFGWVMLYYLPNIFLNHVNTVSDNMFLSVQSYALIIIPIIVGFLGCQIDSVLGATLEQKGLLSNNGVNLVSTSLGGLIAWLLVMLMI